jgi:hypothetical protein
METGKLQLVADTHDLHDGVYIQAEILIYFSGVIPPVAEGHGRGIAMTAERCQSFVLDLNIYYCRRFLIKPRLT